MGEKDVTQKTLEGYNDVFADIINVLLFDGKEVVKEDELSDALPRSYYKAGGTIREQERDAFKLWKNLEIRIAKIGIENQVEASNNMPARVIGYDGAAYRDQIKNGENIRYPVVTVVLYFGGTPWNKAKSIKESISIPDELDPYVNDYKLNLFEISFLTDEQVNMFKSDFRYVADFFVQMRKNDNYVPPKGMVKHVWDILELLRVMSGDDSIAEKFTDNIANEGEKTMEEKNWLENAIDEFRRQGMERGIERGIERGKEQIIENALRGGSTPEEISRVTFVSIEEIQKVQNSMLAEA